MKDISQFISFACLYHLSRFFHAMTRSLSRRWLDVAVDHQQMLHVEAKVNHHQGTGPEKWGILAQNAFLRDSRCTKAYVFPYKVRPRTSMIYLCGATVARRSRVWSDHSRIMLGSFSDRFRIVNGVSPVFRAFVVDRIPL